jgi:hypothetical protein
MTLHYVALAAIGVTMAALMLGYLISAFRISQKGSGS